jgi:hypothetical protein
MRILISVEIPVIFDDRLPQVLRKPGNVIEHIRL